jgi:hypothetical protein
MKIDIKKKTVKNATGNKRIRLKECEEKLFKLMDVGTNPVFNKVPGMLLICLISICPFTFVVLTN